MTTFLSSNIAFLRKRLKISQQELASSLNISRSNIASYESGKAEPRAAKLAEMAKYFDVSLSQFIEEDLASLEPEKRRTSNTNIQEKLNQLYENRKTIVDGFAQKTQRLRKVGIGLRALYELRASQIENPTPQFAIIIRDLENLLEIMDDLINSNEEIIAYLKTVIEK